MTLYKGRLRIELEIEKYRNEGNWRKVGDLSYQLNLKNITNENLATFLRNECALELFLEDNAPNEKNIGKARRALRDIKNAFIKLLNTPFIKDNQQDIAFESELLLAKCYYACGNEQDVMNIYTNMDLNSRWNFSNTNTRCLGLVAELYAMNAFCLERKPPSFIVHSKSGLHLRSEGLKTTTPPLATDYWIDNAHEIEEMSHQNGLNSPQTNTSLSYKNQLEKQCRSAWQSQILNDLKYALIYGYCYLQRKYNKVLTANSTATTQNVANYDPSIYGGTLLDASPIPPGMNEDIRSQSSDRSRNRKGLGGNALGLHFGSTTSGASSNTMLLKSSNRYEPMVSYATHNRTNFKFGRNKKKPTSSCSPRYSQDSVATLASMAGGSSKKASGSTLDSLNTNNKTTTNLELSNIRDINQTQTTNIEVIDGNQSINTNNNLINIKGNVLKDAQTNELYDNEWENDNNMDQEQLTYPSPPAGYVLEKAFLKLPILYLKAGQILKAIIVFRFQLSLMETKYTQNIRQVLCRQLVEVLLKGTSASTYVPIYLSENELQKQGMANSLNDNNSTTMYHGTHLSTILPPSFLAVDSVMRAFQSLWMNYINDKDCRLDSCNRNNAPLFDKIEKPLQFILPSNLLPAKHDWNKAFAPRFVQDEVLLCILLSRSLAHSSAVLNRSPEYREARLATAEDVARINDLLVLCIVLLGSGGMWREGIPGSPLLSDYSEKTLANIRKYKMLTTCLERSIKFNVDRFHTWYRYALSLYTLAASYTSPLITHHYAHSPLPTVTDLGFQGKCTRWSHQRGDMYRAFRAFEECYRIKPKNVTVLLLLSKISLEYLFDIESAIEYALKAVEVCQQQSSLTSSHTSLQDGGGCFDTPELNYNCDRKEKMDYKLPTTAEHIIDDSDGSYSSYSMKQLTSARAYNALGVAYFYKSRKTDITFSFPQRTRYLQLALENFKKALNLDPQNLDYAFNLALQHALLRQLPQATKLAELCLVTELNHYEACHLLVLLKTTMLFPKTTALKRTIEVKNHRGINEKVNIEHALELIDSLIQQSPKNFNLYFTKAEIEAKQIGYQAALATYRQMLNIWKEVKDKYLEKEAEYLRLVKRCDTKSTKLEERFKEATPSQHSRQATETINSEFISVANTPSSDHLKTDEVNHFQALKFHIWIKIAQLYLDHELLEDAFIAIKEAEDISKSSHHTLDMWGKFYMSLGDPTTAKLLFDNALAIKPDFVDALQDLSLAYFYLHNLEMAEIKVREALKIDPTSHKSWYYLGHIYHLRENSNNLATQCYLTAQDLFTTSSIRPFDILKPIF